jgi:hypothetical protein
MRDVDRKGDLFLTSCHSQVPQSVTMSGNIARFIVVGESQALPDIGSSKTVLTLGVWPSA